MLAFSFCKIAQHMDRFLFRGSNEAAGIYDQDVGTRWIFHSTVTVANQKLRHGV
jgi:hypothetical protein